MGLRTVERWLARYRADGLLGPVRQIREDHGRRKLPTEAVELIEGLFLKKPRPSAAAVHRRVLTLCKEREWPLLSYSSVYAIISRLDPALTTLAHEGPARFRDQFELVYRHRASHPNAIWQADHTHLDMLIRDASDQAIRPWLTTVIDDHSRALVGYAVFVGAPSAFQTSLALRQAMWRKADPLGSCLRITTQRNHDTCVRADPLIGSLAGTSQRIRPANDTCSKAAACLMGWHGSSDRLSFKGTWRQSRSVRVAKCSTAVFGRTSNWPRTSSNHIRACSISVRLVILQR